MRYRHADLPLTGVFAEDIGKPEAANECILGVEALEDAGELRKRRGKRAGLDLRDRRSSIPLRQGVFHQVIHENERSLVVGNDPEAVGANEGTRQQIERYDVVRTKRLEGANVRLEHLCWCGVHGLCCSNLPACGADRQASSGARDFVKHSGLFPSVKICTERPAVRQAHTVITYGEMMTIYADVRGLKRWMVPVPVLTPRLSSYWVNVVTPIPAVIARPLIEGLRNENIVHDSSARELFPGVVPTTYRVSVERALDRLQASNVETAWSDALSTSRGDVPPVVLTTQAPR